jgi:hypothetical protein
LSLFVSRSLKIGLHELCMCVIIPLSFNCIMKKSVFPYAHTQADELLNTQADTQRNCCCCSCVCLLEILFSRHQNSLRFLNQNSSGSSSSDPAFRISQVNDTEREARRRRRKLFWLRKEIVEKHLPCNLPWRTDERKKLRNIITNDLTNSLIINSNFVIIS